MSAVPLRGQVWDVAFPRFGMHPAVVLSDNRFNKRLSHVAVVPVTGTPGALETHLALGADAGLTRYNVSYADGTGVQVVDRARFRQHRGLLSPGELVVLEQIVSVFLGLVD